MAETGLSFAEAEKAKEASCRANPTDRPEASEGVWTLEGGKEVRADLMWECAEPMIEDILATVARKNLLDSINPNI